MIQPWEREISYREIKMGPYIQDLTNNLIGTYRFDEMYSRVLSRNEFVRHVAIDLKIGSVKEMNPETLGKIMCSFGAGDVVASHNDLFRRIQFNGDCGEILREMVALCLAYAILERLAPISKPGIPPYCNRAVR